MTDDEQREINAVLLRNLLKALRLMLGLSVELTATQIVLEREGVFDAAAVAAEKATLRALGQPVLAQLETALAQGKPDAMLEFLRRFEGPPQ